jgi:oxygen-dependent protoporphyrinogen oxidase
MTRRSIVVVGGGIAGLAAAWEATGGTSPRGDVFVEVIEAQPSTGGALQTTTFAGRVIDLGADGFLATRGEAVEFVRDIGFEEHLVPIAASGAWIYLQGRLEKIPTGLVLGVPTNFKQVRDLASLSRRAKRQALRDQLFPRRLTVTGDPTIGAILRGKFGDELVDELIEPMIGGIQAGRVDELCASEVFPALLAAARKGGSLMRAITPPKPAEPTTPKPVFYSLDAGVGALPTHLRELLVSRGVAFRTGEAVTSIRHTPNEARALRVETATSVTPADAVVMATPPQVAGQLLGSHSADVRALEFMKSASSTMVTFAVPKANCPLPENGTGVLVPLKTPFRTGHDSLITTAITFLDRKWSRLANDDVVIVRIHTGRIDDERAMELNDEAIAERVHAELEQIFGSWPAATQTWVQRWPHALPQYLSGHRAVINAAREALRPMGIFLGGMAYDGVGVPASIGSGRRAGLDALAHAQR